MTKALFRKQMMEVFSWLYKDKKSGKNRSKGGIIGFAVLYLLLFGFLGGIFYVAANMLCAPLYEIVIFCLIERGIGVKHAAEHAESHGNQPH